MPKGKGYGKKKGGRKGTPIRKTMRGTKRSGKKIYYVGGYQA